MINITYFLLEFPIDFCRTVGPKCFCRNKNKIGKKSKEVLTQYTNILHRIMIVIRLISLTVPAQS